MKITNPPVITIDGPGGTGKGTISHLLARKLGWHFLDSGVLYRVLGFAALEVKVVETNAVVLTQMAKDLDVEFRESLIGEAARVFLAGRDVTAEIRSEQCGSMASKISALPTVREALLERQRDFRKPPGLVTDGRDMGTIVFPDATVKIYLNASREERAKRRFSQLQHQGISVSLHAILQELEERDARDQTRAIAPLKPAVDAVLIDTTELSVEQVFQKVLAEVSQQLQKLGLSV